MKSLINVVILIGVLSVTACGGGGGSTAAPAATPAPPVVVPPVVTPAPIITMTFATPTVNVATSDVLTWSSTNATSCTGTGAWSGVQLTSGTLTVTPTAAGQTTYTLNCMGVGGNAVPISVNLTANPISLAFDATATKSPNANTLGYEPTNATYTFGGYYVTTGIWGVTSATSYTDTISGSISLSNGVPSVSARPTQVDRALS